MALLIEVAVGGVQALRVSRANRRKIEVGRYAGAKLRAFRRACVFIKGFPNFSGIRFTGFDVQRRGRVRYVQPSPGLGNGLGACVIGARLGAVICIGSAGLDLAPRFASVWSRCAVLPFSPIASTCARLRLYSI